jgi:succinate dehydrogenase / fumarate reductase, cytochrome b subunit
MTQIAKTLTSTIGAKALMATTGVLLMGFVFQHMFANLQIFGAPEKINAYAHFMQSLGPVLWVLRLGLLAIVVGHIWAAMKVTAANRAARPVQYAHKKKDLATSYAARTMLISGLIVVLFIIFHIAHFTAGAVDLAGSYGHMTQLKDGTEVHDVYKMVVQGFQHLPTALIYIIANLLLSFHLAHGAASMLQTIGLRGKENSNMVKIFGIAFGTTIAVGNVSMPVAVLLGWIG